VIDKIFISIKKIRIPSGPTRMPLSICHGCIANKNEQRMPAPPNPHFLSKMPTNKIEKREAQKLGNLKANSLNCTFSAFAKNDQTLCETLSIADKRWLLSEEG